MLVQAVRDLLLSFIKGYRTPVVVSAHAYRSGSASSGTSTSVNLLFKLGKSRRTPGLGPLLDLGCSVALELLHESCSVGVREQHAAVF